MFLIMSILFGVSSFGLLGGAVWAYFSQQRKMEGGVAVVGTVVELTRQSAVVSRSSMFYPVVEFSAMSGEKVRFVSSFGSRPVGYKVGQSVNVRYDAVDTQKAEIESKMTLWLVPLILVFIGIVACCLTVVFLAFYWMGASPS